MNCNQYSVVITLLGCFAATPALAANLTIKGSDTMVILAQRWADIDMKS